MASAVSCPPHDDEWERTRQAAVDASGLLQGRASRDLQAIVERAARIFQVPIAAISVIDHQRQWFAARTGLEPSETPRSHSFCAHAIHRPGAPMIVTDAAIDPRFSANPLVTASPNIRFYAGMPLVDRNGYALGALCVIDTKPRMLPENLIQLTMLAHEAEGALAR